MEPENWGWSNTNTFLFQTKEKLVNRVKIQKKGARKKTRLIRKTCCQIKITDLIKPSGKLPFSSCQELTNWAWFDPTYFNSPHGLPVCPFMTLQIGRLLPQISWVFFPLRRLDFQVKQSLRLQPQMSFLLICLRLLLCQPQTGYFFPNFEGAPKVLAVHRWVIDVNINRWQPLPHPK